MRELVLFVSLLPTEPLKVSRTKLKKTRYEVSKIYHCENETDWQKHPSPIVLSKILCQSGFMPASVEKARLEVVDSISLLCLYSLFWPYITTCFSSPISAVVIFFSALVHCLSAYLTFCPLNKFVDLTRPSRCNRENECLSWVASFVLTHHQNHAT